MPLYEYECLACRHRFERIQKFSDPPADTCPVCEGKVRKLLSSPAIQFKGSGWYITDYAKKGGSGSGEKSSDSGKASEGSTKSESSDSSGDSGSKPAAATTPTKTE